MEFVHILTLHTEWSGHNGISVFNQQLSQAFASIGRQVTARVAEPGASDGKVRVQALDPLPGIDSIGQLLRTDDLPGEVGLLIGHSRFSGAAATYLRDRVYPSAKAALFIHTSPEEGHRLRGLRERADMLAEIDVAIAADADIVFTLGPMLTMRTRRLASSFGVPGDRIREIVPGVSDGAVAGDMSYGDEFRILVLGRLDDPIKAAGLAADVVGVLRQNGMRAQLVLRGAGEESVGELERTLSKRARSPVWVRPFTTDRAVVERELRAADVLLVTSQHEGFGLVAFEAAGHAVPILVSRENSGVGMFLSDPRRVPVALGLPGTVSDSYVHEERVRLWADAVTRTLTDLAEARGRARKLREYLLARHSWQRCAETLLDELAQLGRPGRLDLR